MEGPSEFIGIVIWSVVAGVASWVLGHRVTAEELVRIMCGITAAALIFGILSAVKFHKLQRSLAAAKKELKPAVLSLVQSYSHKARDAAESASAVAKPVFWEAEAWGCNPSPLASNITAHDAHCRARVWAINNAFLTRSGSYFVTEIKRPSTMEEDVEKKSRKAQVRALSPRADARRLAFLSLDDLNTQIEHPMFLDFINFNLLKEAYSPSWHWRLRRSFWQLFSWRRFLRPSRATLREQWEDRLHSQIRLRLVFFAGNDFADSDMAKHAKASGHEVAFPDFAIYDNKLVFAQDSATRQLRFVLVNKDVTEGYHSWFDEVWNAPRHPCNNEACDLRGNCKLGVISEGGSLTVVTPDIGDISSAKQFVDMLSSCQRLKASTS
jgi:hypothetical protein